jgi:signal transduction histidine kinase
MTTGRGAHGGRESPGRRESLRGRSHAPAVTRPAAAAGMPATAGGAGGGRQPPRTDKIRRLPAIAEDAASRWPLGRIVAAGMLALGAVLIAAIIVGALALNALSSDRDRVVSTLDPAALDGSQLYAALLNQETGLRGFLLSGQQPFLGPYTLGLAAQRRDVKSLRPLLAGLPVARTHLDSALRSIARWRSGYAEPAIKHVTATGMPMPGDDIAKGRLEFDSIRLPMSQFQSYLAAQRKQAVAHLNGSATVLDAVGIASAVMLLLVVSALGVAIRAAAIRPITRLAANARQVAAGDFDHEVDPAGPREVHTLAVDVDRMRERILSELSAVRAANATLEARALDLERSNAELEQFAYVASHDLQEPLRKVASFCQLLQRRYIGQLDARADQYIEFAVDGAKRMQALIDDLLTFSRVGRSEREAVLVSAASALSQARVNLTTEIRKSGAVIQTAELPVVKAEFSLLTSLFQNLLGNAIKFRGDKPPVIEIAVVRQDNRWLFSVADNGIGIEPEFAERIFIIFQRLHDRTAYAGTGIGLAMCRKIVEHYGGSIWLDTDYHPGAKFNFTLPVAPADDEETSDD